MTNFINLLSNDVWSEADILARGRALIAAQVSTVRQQELQTIMLGHMAQMRTATPEELAEIALVGQITEAQAFENAQARFDMALLLAVMAYEVAAARLALPVVDGDEADALDRAAAQIVVDAATPEVLDLYALRHPS